MSSNTTQTRHTRYNIKFVSDKVCQWLATGRWFSPGTPLSSTNETDRHNIAEKLLTVALNTINQTFIMIFELTKIILYRLERFPKRYKNIIWNKNNIDDKMHIRQEDLMCLQIVHSHLHGENQLRRLRIIFYFFFISILDLCCHSECEC